MAFPESPIPEPAPNDHEDVSWALSTAEANWKRGDHSDALRWLQRAAETASEAGLDTRYLELAKAAADLAGRIESSPRMSPVPPGPGPRASATAIQPMPVILPDRKSGAPPLPARSSSSLPAKPAAPRVGTSAPPVRASGAPTRASSPPARASAPPRTSAAPQRPSQPPRASAAPPARRDSKSDDKKKKPGARPERPQLSALTRPLDAEDMTQISPPVTEAHPEIPGATLLGPPPAEAIHHVDESELEPWPTQTSADPEAPRRRPNPVDNAPTLVPNPEDVRPMQALRVVLTKTPDGLRISLPGKNLQAMSTEVLLVALEPGTDLKSWLK